VPFYRDALKVIQVFDVASGIFRDLFEDEDEEDAAPTYPLNPTPPPSNYPLGPPPDPGPTPDQAQMAAELQEALRQQQQTSQESAAWERRAREAEAAQATQQSRVDPYTILGVTANAPDFVVKAAYKAAAKRTHADAGGTDAAMVRLNNAMAEITRRRGWKIVK
jgi:hypothetical protein